ncbi:hypothetical protein ABIA33_006517 [Streptacidiphilus sp. MAP12-16]|uniref:hypothetical protein n=1 Tax=Streptacidiphilus sp. MAP12-16 TaxID=3156300 RepID=UPI0035152302
MPGSTTIGHSHPTVTISHEDAERLATVLGKMSEMLETAGPDRITDAQVGTLCDGHVDHRAEFTEWTRQLTRQIRAHL